MFRYAEYIYEIYKQKSFTGAAKALYISQPALSATVKKVEQELGVQLFDRRSTPLSLTSEGEAYIRAVEEMHRTRHNFETYLADVSAGQIGYVSVGGAMFIASFILPHILMAFAKRYPHIHVDLIESASKELEARLLAEQTDLMLDYRFDEQHIQKHPLLTENVLLSVPKTYVVNKTLLSYALSAADVYADRPTPAVPLDAFQNESFILLKSGNDMGTRAISLCAEYGFTPNPTLLLDQLLTSYNISRSGLGIAFVTDTLVKAVPETNDLVFYRVSGASATRTLYIAHKKNRYLNRAVQEFLDTALSQYQKKP